MSERRWYRSLYWRLGLGLFAFLALMLAAQGALYLWMTERIAGSMPARDPRRLAVLVASDVAAALAGNPDLDLEQYVRAEFGTVFQTVLVIMDDGRVVSNRDDVPRELAAVRAELLRRQNRRRERGLAPWPPFRVPGDAEPQTGPPPMPLPDFDGERPPGAPPFARRGGPGFPRMPRLPGEFFAPILVANRPVGRVTLLPGGPSLTLVARELGPTMGLLGGAVLVVGMGLVALVVFGPVRRRLRQLQEATERLGRGDLSARAPATGGDEVAAVARSFNQMADELTTRADALARSDKARRQLLADVSHELMTPLTAMRGYIETLGMPEVQLSDDTRERYLGIVTEETHRLEHIVGDLLDLARLEGGGAPVQQQPVEVQALFDRVAQRHERELATRAITLGIEVAAGAEWVVGDAGRLEQALQNLAANALRHTPDGGSLRLEAAPVAGGIRIRVRDSGPGIAPEHLPLIFERFYKVDVSRRATGGSGLGLSIVKAIVDAHGGTIVAFNEQGAVFDIVLRAAQA